MLVASVGAGGAAALIAQLGPQPLAPLHRGVLREGALGGGLASSLASCAASCIIALWCWPRGGGWLPGGARVGALLTCSLSGASASPLWSHPGDAPCGSMVWGALEGPSLLCHHDLSHAPWMAAPPQKAEAAKPAPAAGQARIKAPFTALGAGAEAALSRNYSATFAHEMSKSLL